MILDKIVAKKRILLEAAKQVVSLDEMIMKTERKTIERRSFKKALSDNKDIAIIGEIKKASPSKGLIRADFNPSLLAKIYGESDIQALSVLTETVFFLGHPNYLSQAREACDLPVLRKDFIIDSYQIYEAYCLGADAILLIVAILNDEELTVLMRLAKALSLDVLMEVHDEAELDRAQKLGADIIGINNRNLNDFSVNLATSERLIPMMDKGTVVVSESGIHSRVDVLRMKDAGANALLIGETFMREPDMIKAIQKIRGTV